MKIKHLVILFLALFFNCKNEAKKTVTQTEVTFKKEGELSLLKKDSDSLIAKLNIEIADNDYERETGLMYRDEMKTNQGMLFVFDSETPRYFYMKNTRFALDLIFLDSNNTIVSFQENAQPFNENSLPSNAPAQYVLEVNAGQVEAWNLQVGDKMGFQPQ